MNTKNTTNGNTNHGDNSNMKNLKTATLIWILKYNRTPYPYSPLNAAKKECEPKQPGYFDGNYFKQLKWKNYQDWGQLTEDVQQELIKLWHGDKRVEGIGCNAGWNGEFYLSMIDVDSKNFESLEAMEQAISGWENRNPGISLCPRVRTQSGGYRYFIGFESIPKDWGNTISFTFTQCGEKSLGELMVGPGALGIILGKGLKGDYSWDRNACGDVPVFQSPELVGLFEIEKVQKINSIYDNKSTSEEAREALNFIPVSQFDEDYQGWINLGMACHAAGLDFEDWDNWSQGGKGYSNSKDTFNHWKSFNNSGGITPGTLFKFAKDNGWKPTKQQQQTSKNNTPKASGTAALKPEIQSKVVPINKYQQQPIDIDLIEEELREIAEQNLPKSKEQLKLNELANKANIQPRDLQETYKNFKEEREEKEAQSDLKIDIDELLKNRNQTLDLTQYLPGYLSQIAELSTRLGLRPELSLSAFLSVVSSLQNINNEIDLLGYTNFRQPLGLFNAICAEPSQKKSPLINMIATEPLRELQRETRKIYEQEMADYNALPDDQKPPEKPVERAYFAHNMTQAGMRNLLNIQSKNGWGILILCDELAGNFKNNKKSYNDGMTEDLLSAYDSFGKREYLKDGWASDYDRCLVSILGGIQPDVMREFNNGSDSNGKWARFNYINQPTSPFIIPTPTPAKIDVKPMLADFYRKIAALPQLNLKLSPKAEKNFITINNKCELYRVNAKTQALAAQWGKAPGKIGRFAALIHIIHEVAQFGTVTSDSVSAQTLKLATNLAKFYLAESVSLYGECEGELAPQLAKILELAEKRQTPISPRDVIRSNREFRKLKSDDIRAMFTQLDELGYGSIVGTGAKIQFSRNLSPVSPVVTSGGDTSKDIQDKDSSHLSPVSPEKKENFELNQPIMDNPTQLDENSKEAESVVTVVTKTENNDTEPLKDCHRPGDSVVTVVTTGDSPEPTPELTPAPEPLPNDYRPTLKELTSADPLPPLTHLAFINQAHPDDDSKNKKIGG